MSYQEIYGDLNKKASKEQIKKLAATLKEKKMAKKASAEQVKKLAHALGMKKKADLMYPLVKAVAAPVVQGVRSAAPAIKEVAKNTGKEAIGIASKTLSGAKPWKTVLKRTALAGVPILTAAGGFAGGNSGKAALRADLAAAKSDIGKLKEENKALREEGIWTKILKKLGEWWESISKSWNAGRENAATSTSAAKQ